MNNKALWIGVGFLFALALITGYLLLGKGGEVPVRTHYAVTRTQVPGVSNQITVSGNEYSFNPASLSLNKGDRVVLTFQNTGKLPHNLTIDELGVSTKTIEGGETDSVEFTVSKSGNFSFYCSVGSHRSLGMEGGVTVK